MRPKSTVIAKRLRAAFLLLGTLQCFIITAQAESNLPLIGPLRAGADHVPEPIKDLKSGHKIKVVYFIAQDREPAKNYQEKFETLLAFVSDVYKRDLNAKGYPCNGLDFEFKNSRLDIRMLNAKHAASHYNLEPTYASNPRVFSQIMDEVSEAYGAWNKNFYLVLAETYGAGPAKFEWPGGFALGAHNGAEGGAGTFSSWILRDEFCATTIEGQMKLLADDTPIEGRTALGNGRLNSPRFEFIEDGFGAVCHELGHAFGCPHDMRMDNNFIMANGFRRLRVNYLSKFYNSKPMCFSVDNARILARSRFLNPNVDCNDTTPPTLKVEAPAMLHTGAKKIPLTITAEDNAGLSALLFFLSKGDSVRGGCELIGTKQQITCTVDVPPLEAGEVMLRTSVIDVGGNLVTVGKKIKIEPETPPAQPTATPTQPPVQNK